VALGLVTVWFQQSRAIAGEYIPIGGAAARIAGAGIAAGFYLLKCLFPAGLMPIYPRWDLAHPPIAPCLAWIAIACAAVWLCTRRPPWGRHLVFALGCFAVNLLPVLGFVPMAYLRISRVADHFAYLSLVPIVGLAVAGLAAWRARAGKGPGRFLPILCTVAIFAAFAWEARGYAATFRSEAASAAYTLSRDPDSWYAHFRMGDLLKTQGAEADKAMAEYREALRIFPQSAEAHSNLGNLLFDAGRVAEAVREFREAVEILPNYPAAQNGLAMALNSEGNAAEALAHVRLALRLNPDFPEARNNLGNSLVRLGRTDDAIAQYREALRLRPSFPEACNNLGVALTMAGRFPEAVAEFEQALRLRPGYPDAERNLAGARARAGP
jgi:tetratricopeptide (TPR) repeat protein